MVWGLLAACVALASMLAYSLKFNLRHARIIFDVEDALGEALDVCDASYRKMSEVMETPVAADSPEVRQVIDQMEAVRQSVLYVSNVLAEPYGGIVEETAIEGQEA